LEHEGDCSALISLQAPQAAQDYYLSDLDGYKVLFTFVKRLSRNEWLVIRHAAAVSYSYAMPFLISVVKRVRSKVTEEYSRLQASFKKSLNHHHLRQAYRKSIFIIRQCEENAKKYKDRIFPEASRRFAQSMTNLQICKERVGSHLQGLSRDVNGFCHGFERLASKNTRSIKTVLGNSQAAQRLGGMLRFLASSPVARHMGEAHRFVVANPVTNKIIETSVGFLVDASLTSYYG
jgi:hypothetical protein